MTNSYGLPVALESGTMRAFEGQYKTHAFVLYNDRYQSHRPIPLPSGVISGTQRHASLDGGGWCVTQQAMKSQVAYTNHGIRRLPLLNSKSCSVWVNCTQDDAASLERHSIQPLTVYICAHKRFSVVPAAPSHPPCVLLFFKRRWL